MQKADRLVREAVAKGANIILLQELFETPYFCQKHEFEHMELSMPLEKNPAVAHFKQVAKELDDSYVRGFLGRMLFTGDESLKKVKVLSGGEKVRCMLSKLMLSGANCITMDDPTNHLDLEAIQSLNEGLIAFPGVILFSSHDHEFIQSIANRIVEITPNGIIDRMMSFDDYISDPQVSEMRKKLYEGTGKKIKYRV